MYYGEPALRDELLSFPEEDGYGSIALAIAVMGLLSAGAKVGGEVYLSKKEKEAQEEADAEALKRLEAQAKADEAQAKADAEAREDETVIEKLKGKFWTKTIKTAGAVAVASAALWWAFREKK